MLLPQQQAVLDPLTNYALQLLQNPGASLAPLYDLTRSRINEQYAQAPQALAQRFLAHGGAQSGKFGRAARETELARMSQLGALDQDFASKVLEMQGRGASLAQNLLSMAFGEQGGTSMSTLGTSSSTQSGSSQGTAGGNIPYGLLSGGLAGLGDMMALSVLQKMLQGGRMP
jgi:hypothetical protein